MQRDMKPKHFLKLQIKNTIHIKKGFYGGLKENGPQWEGHY